MKQSFIARVTKLELRHQRPKRQALDPSAWSRSSSFVTPEKKLCFASRTRTREMIDGGAAPASLGNLVSGVDPVSELLEDLSS